MKRRDLLKGAALGIVSLPGGRDVAGRLGKQSTQGSRAAPSDRIRVGFIGVGGFGYGTNLPDFMQNRDVEVAAICDVLESNL